MDLFLANAPNSEICLHAARSESMVLGAVGIFEGFSCIFYLDLFLLEFCV